LRLDREIALAESAAAGEAGVVHQHVDLDAHRLAGRADGGGRGGIGKVTGEHGGAYAVPLHQPGGQLAQRRRASSSPMPPEAPVIGAVPRRFGTLPADAICHPLAVGSRY